MASLLDRVNIVVVAKPDDDTLCELSHLPENAQVTAIGSSIEDFLEPEKKTCLEEADVVLNCIGTAPLISQLWPSMKNLKWMHSRFAGVDHLLFPEFRSSNVILTNARGLFSSSLAEYCMLGCLYFAKDVRRLKAQQQNSHWEKFVVTELRGSTMGIIGYGDIGRACARLAKAFGMKVIIQRRRPELSSNDELVDEAYGPGHVGDVMTKSDYIVVAAALTPDSLNLVSEAEFQTAKPGSVIMNLGRGPIINEDALIEALRSGDRLAGAVLDVFTVEPLPSNSPLWQMENVLLSPHNADMTSDFLHRSVKAFAKNVPRFMKNEDLELHVVDKVDGY